jgi:hypothetical protein
MNSISIPGNWEEIKKKMQLNFRHLTERDLNYTKGKENELIVRLERKLGNKKDEVIDIIHRISVSN